MKKKEINKIYNEYKNYFRFKKACKSDKAYLKSLKVFIDGNIKLITNCTWYDMAGGFMLFCIEIQGSTYCICNDFWDDENNTTIYHDLSLKAYIELNEIDYDLSLLLQEYKRIIR